MFAEALVSDLVGAGHLRIEDGNHGECRPRPGEFVAEGVPYIRAADINGGVVNWAGAGQINTLARDRVRKGVGLPGDSLLSHKGTVGLVARAPQGAPDFVCSPQTTFWRTLDEDVLRGDFLRYSLESSHFQAQLRAIERESDMAAYVSLTQQKRLRLNLPPVRTQRAIADVLGALDDKNAANLLLERAADDLIAAYAERVGLAAVESVSFLTAVDVTFGAAFKGALFAPPAEGRPLIRIRDLKTHTPQTWTTEERRDETVIVPGDVVVGMDADFEPAWWLGEPALLNQRVMRVSCDAWGSALTRYLVTPPLRQIQSSKTGTTVAHLNKSDLATLNLPKLPQESVAAVRGIVDPLLARRVASAKERSRLGSLRDVLLPELMSGRLRVKDAEKTVEEVV